MANTGRHPTMPPKTNWLDIGFKVLTIAILPLLGLGAAMHSDLALAKERISNIQAQQVETRTQFAAMDTRINQIALTVQDTNGQIRELRTVLDFIRSQVANQAPAPIQIRPRIGGVR